MAEVKSGSFKTSTYSGADDSPSHYIFSWTLKSQSIENNNSTISWTLSAAGGLNEYYWIYIYDKYVTVNGSTQSNTTGVKSYNGTVAFSGTTTISHSTDGKGKFSASAGGAFFYSGSYNSTGSGSWDLPTIPRATTPTLSATTVTMGSSITITMSPASTTYKHKLRYDFGTVTNSVTGISIGENYTAQGNTTATFTPPTSLGSQVPTAMSGTGTLYCYTYASDGTHIGTKSVSITLNVPSYTPSISGITLTGNNLLSSTYVQGKSTATIYAVLNTSYGATTKSVSIVMDGKTYTTLPVTTSVLSNGSKSAAITFTDSRGKSVTATSSAITVYEYSAPNISVFTMTRQSNGTSVNVNVQGTISSVNSKNAKTIKVTLNGVTQTITSSSYTINGTTTFTGVPTDSTFNATATFTDSYTTITKNATLPTVAVTMDFHNSGAGIALGKVAESTDLLDVAWSQRVRKNLTVDGTIMATGNVTTSGSLSAGSLTTSGNATVGGTLTVSGKTLLNLIYPVGSIYMSVNSTSPATLFGGTWSQLKDRFLLGAGDTYTLGWTGGEATHTLSVTEIPSHNHPYGVYDASSSATHAINHMAAYCGKVNSTGWGSHTLYTGGGGAHNNMPPYLVVYMWKRTA